MNGKGKNCSPRHLLWNCKAWKWNRKILKASQQQKLNNKKKMRIRVASDFTIRIIEYTEQRSNASDYEKSDFNLFYTLQNYQSSVKAVWGTPCHRWVLQSRGEWRASPLPTEPKNVASYVWPPISARTEGRLMWFLPPLFLLLKNVPVTESLGQPLSWSWMYTARGPRGLCLEPAAVLFPGTHCHQQVTPTGTHTRLLLPPHLCSFHYIQATSAPCLTIHCCQDWERMPH